MPTSAALTFSRAACDPVINADDTMESMVPVKLGASLTLASGTLLGEVSATPGTYKAYDPTANDGTEVPAGILRRASTTDGSGTITNWNEWAVPVLTASMYTEGTFRTQDLVGLDANAIELLGGHLVEGTVTTGLFAF